MIFVKNLKSVSDQEWSSTDKYPVILYSINLNTYIYDQRIYNIYEPVKVPLIWTTMSPVVPKSSPALCPFRSPSSLSPHLQSMCLHLFLRSKFSHLDCPVLGNNLFSSVQKLFSLCAVFKHQYYIPRSLRKFMFFPRSLPFNNLLGLFPH